MEESRACICASIEDEKMTNQEKIERMSIIEAAEFYAAHSECERCIYEKDASCNDKRCLEGQAEWYSQEAGDEV